MTMNISPRDWEALSALLDGQLGPKERARLERNLQENADFRQAYEDLRRTRAILRATPRLRAPRSFALKAEMVAAPRRTFPGFNWFPAFRMTSALASLMLIAVMVGEFLMGGQGAATFMAEQPAPATVQQEAAAEALPEAAMEAPADAARNAAPEATAADVQSLAAAPAAAGAYPEPTEDADLSAFAVEAPPTVEGGAELATPDAAAPDAVLAMEAPADNAYPMMEPSAKMAPEAALETSSEPSEAPLVPGPSQFWTGWWISELVLAAIAILAGLIALLLWRSGRA